MKESRIPSKTKAKPLIFGKSGQFSEKSTFYLDPDIVKMEISAVSFWLQRLVLEVRKVNKEHQQRTLLS